MSSKPSSFEASLEERSEKLLSSRYWRPSFHSLAEKLELILIILRVTLNKRVAFWLSSWHKARLARAVVPGFAAPRDAVNKRGWRSAAKMSIRIAVRETLMGFAALYPSSRA